MEIYNKKIFNSFTGCIAWIGIIGLISLVVSCRMADVNILGVKTFTFKQRHTGDTKEIIRIPSEKSDGIYTLQENGLGTITGRLSSSDSTLLVYAQVSFALVDEDFTKERWTNFYSDKAGGFSIRNLPEGTYKIATTQVNAYLTVYTDVAINAENPMITLRLELIPIE